MNKKTLGQGVKANEDVVQLAKYLPNMIRAFGHKPDMLIILALRRARVSELQDYSQLYIEIIFIFNMG